MAWKLAVLTMIFLALLPPTTLASDEPPAEPQHQPPILCDPPLGFEWCCEPVIGGGSFAWAVECVVTITDYATSQL